MKLKIDVKHYRDSDQVIGEQLINIPCKATVASEIAFRRQSNSDKCSPTSEYDFYSNLILC